MVHFAMNKIMRYTFIATFAFLSTLFSPISLMAQSSKGLGFPCYSNDFKLELTTTKKSITTCNDTVQLSVSYTGRPDIYWTDGYYGATRVVSSSGVFQAYAYDSAFNCVDTTAAVMVTVNDAYIKAYSGSFTNPTKLCDGSSVTLYSYSTAPVKWNTGETSNNIEVTKAGKYFAIAKSVNGCEDTSEILEVVVNSVKRLNIKANSDTIICLGDSVEMELTTQYGYNSFFWNPYYSKSKKIKIGGSGGINVYALDSATGCSIKSNTIQVSVLTPSIEPLCMVTVDSATGRNKLIWNVSPGKRTAYYNIYRESNFAGEFDLIGDADLTNAGTFLDTQVNPKQRPFTYYIDAIDSCNNKAEYSKYYAHTTLHLTANLGVNGENNLNWSDYVGIYPLNTYIIYRSNNSGKFTAIASVAATVKSFSDLNPPSGKNRYYIGIKGQTACDTTGSTLSINSNMVALGLLSTQDIKKQGISISPNPCSDFLEIQLGAIPSTTLTIYNAQGSVVRQIQVSGESQPRIQVSELPAGVYWINDAMGRSSKFIKE
jgi:hypothetical protein